MWSMVVRLVLFGGALLLASVALSPIAEARRGGGGHSLHLFGGHAAARGRALLGRSRGRSSGVMELPAAGGKNGRYFSNCREARAAHAAPMRTIAQGYRPALDRNNNGVACE